jgi:hypothetical protein
VSVASTRGILYGAIDSAASHIFVNSTDCVADFSPLDIHSVAVAGSGSINGLPVHVLPGLVSNLLSVSVLLEFGFHCSLQLEGSHFSEASSGRYLGPINRNGREFSASIPFAVARHVFVDDVLTDIHFRAFSAKLVSSSAPMPIGNLDSAASRTIANSSALVDNC